VFVVALATLTRPVDDEIAPLAADLGVTPYEAGLLLRAPMPAIILRSDDKARALAMLARLRDRGHDAVGFDATQIASSDAMTPLRMFRFDGDALVSIAQSGAEERLPYAELTAIVRAMCSATTETVEKETKTKLSVGRAVLTGGLVATKTTTTEKRKRSEQREPVIYLFRREGVPWILRSTHARYDGLGADLRPTTIENLASFVRLLRERAPAALFDERLLSVKNADTRTLEILANVVAVSIARGT